MGSSNHIMLYIIITLFLKLMYTVHASHQTNLNNTNFNCKRNINLNLLSMITWDSKSIQNNQINSDIITIGISSLLVVPVLRASGMYGPYNSLEYLSPDLWELIMLSAESTITGATMAIEDFCNMGYLQDKTYK